MLSPRLKDQNATARGRPIAFCLWTWGRSHNTRYAVYAALAIAIAMLVGSAYFRYLQSVVRCSLVGRILDISERGSSFQWINGELVRANVRGPAFRIDLDRQVRTHGLDEVDALQVYISVNLIQAHPGTDPKLLDQLDVPMIFAAQALEETTLPPSLAGQRPIVDSATRSPTTVTLTLSNPATARRNARQYALGRLWDLSLLLVFAALAGEFAAFAGRKIRVFAPDQCQSCGYPLGDLPDPVCPECGKRAPLARP